MENIEGQGNGGFGGGGASGSEGDAADDGGGGGGGYDGGNGGGFRTPGGGGSSFTSGADQFTTLGAGTGNGSVTITMHVAPTITGVQPTESASTTAPVTPFTTVAISAESPTLTVTATVALSSTANGTLSNLGAGTLSGNTYTVIGTAAQDTAAIDALVFTPATAPATTETTTFTQTANDGAESAATTPTTALTVTQPPVPISASDSASTVATTDEAAVHPFSAVAITDPNTAQSETATVSLNAANGVLSDPNATTDGGTISNGVYTVSGSATAVAAALDGLVFTPKPHQAAPGTVVSTLVTAAISDTAGQSTALATTVNATAVNDAPVISGAANVSTSDETPIKPFTGVSITDPDTGVSETVTLTLSSGGTLSGTGITATSAAGVYTVTGTLATVNTDLQAAMFTPIVTHAAPGTTVLTTIGIADVQSGFAGTPTSTAAPASETITAIAANDPPTISGAASVRTSDVTPVKPLAGVSITDPDSGVSETVTLTLSGGSANGALSGTGITATGTPGVYTVTGTTTVVTADLQAAVFTPTITHAAPGTAVVSTIGIADVQSGLPGTPTSTAAPASVTLTAIAANDAPVLSGTKAGQTTVDYVPIQPFATVKVTDVDAPDGAGVTDSVTIKVLSGSTATDANGKLSVGGTTGAALTESAPGVYTLTAADPAALTSAIDALTFTPTQAEVKAGSTVTTAFQLTPSQTAAGATATGATDSTTTVTVTALNYVNGPANGFGVLFGTTSADVITAHGQFNAIFGLGGNDFINAGSGNAAVTLGDGNASVTLGGGFNLVLGGNGNVTVTGAPGGNSAVTLGNGNDTVNLAGMKDAILLGTGSNVVMATGGMAFVTTGAGNDTVTLGGTGNTVNAGAGQNVIVGGTGLDTFVLPAASQGFDAISGFTERNGDVLDLRAALASTNWNHQSNTLANYLKVTDSPGSTNLAIAPTGSGSGIAIASLTGTTNYGLSDLISSHSLLTA